MTGMGEREYAGISTYCNIQIIYRSKIFYDYLFFHNWISITHK